MPVTRDSIRQMIEDEKNRPKDYRKPKDSYKGYMPIGLVSDKPYNKPTQQSVNSISRRGNIATRTSKIRAQNEKEKELKRKAHKKFLKERREYNRLKKNQPRSYNFKQRSMPYPKVNITGGSKGRTGKVKAHAPLKTINWHGHRFTVNSTAAPRFLGLLNDLHAEGYKPVSIGGYSNRNIAGTNTRSLHSYGLAIDIDARQNPVDRSPSNGFRSNLPPDVASLAARYGLSWGGNWHSYKDPMHFSVPWGGRE